MLAAIFKMTKPCCSTLLLLLLLLSGAFPPKFLSAVSCRVLRLLTDPERADRLPTNKLQPPQPRLSERRWGRRGPRKRVDFLRNLVNRRRIKNAQIFLIFFSVAAHPLVRAHPPSAPSYDRFINN